MEQFGLETIEWITIGDSRIDWGINHHKILKQQKQNNINHLRLSLRSANFLAIQTSIDWSIKNLPNLKGIMIGAAEANFGKFDDVFEAIQGCMALFV